MENISRLTNKTDEIIPRVLEAGGEVVLEEVRSRLNAVVGHTEGESRSTGELAASLGLSPAKVDQNGNYNVKVGMKEPRSDGDSNAKIANILEFGRHNQPPRPFLKPAKAASKVRAVDAMQHKLEEELRNL
jgi:HK97 gp10 family phage protein